MVVINYFRIKVTGVLMKDTEYYYLMEELSRLINKAIGRSKVLREIHKVNTFKNYCFDGLSPVEKEGYKKFKIYSFNIKTIDKVFAQELIKGLKDLQNDLLMIHRVNSVEEVVKNVDVLYTLTPAIAVMEKGKHWQESDYSLEDLRGRINSNIQRKYKSWYEEEVDVDHDMIEDIELLNERPIIFKYKEGVLITNKFRLTIKKDDLSQKLGKFMYAVGALEKNSLGMGYIVRC